MQPKWRLWSRANPNCEPSADPGFFDGSKRAAAALIHSAHGAVEEAYATLICALAAEHATQNER
jgi:hypothetical protein